MYYRDKLQTLIGHLSDKIGRKNIMMAGMLLGVLFYRPIFGQLYNIADTTKKVFVSESTLLPNSSLGSNDGHLVKIYNDGTKEKIIKKRKEKKIRFI